VERNVSCQSSPVAFLEFVRLPVVIAGLVVKG
jgi:hypothetical protein